MISVILIWSYIFITAYLIGYGALRGIFDRDGIITRRADSYLMAGIVVLTVYAQIFSIFYKVGLLANVVLVLLCIGVFLIFRRQLIADWQVAVSACTIKKTGIMLIILLVFAYGTSTGIIHYDTGLYHAQSIRWIEEYGLVKGLGNLHCRLAYNSAAFCLSALYSMAFIGGQSYHCVVGFLALVLFGVCTGDITGHPKKVLLSDFAKIAAIYYLLNIYDEMVSPASDYFVLLMIFYLIIKWLMLLESKQKSYLPYALLCLLGVCIMTVKLSAAFILILTVKPAFQLLREKRSKEISLFLITGVMTALPYVIRNILISGWLVYPYTGIDLFAVDWKIPRGIAEYDYKEIQVWGRGYKNVADYDLPIGQWFADWFAGQGRVDQVFILAAISTAVILLAALVVMLIRKKWDMADWLLVAGTLCLSFFFWLTSAPLIRYGCVYVWLTPLVTYGYFFAGWRQEKIRNAVFAGAVILFGCYKAVAFGKEVTASFQTDTLVLQKDYENFTTIPYTLQGFIFYYPQEGDRTGYQDFPSSPGKAAIKLRGETIEEGFISTEGSQSWDK